MSQTDSRPDEWEDMTAAEKQAWADERGEQLDAATDAAMQLSDVERDALEALSEPEAEKTETVELNGQRVMVRTYIDAEHEELLTHIANNQNDFAEVRGAMVEVMAWLIRDDRFGGEMGERVWDAYAERYGVTSLIEPFYNCVEPSLNRLERSEVAQKFRENR